MTLQDNLVDVQDRIPTQPNRKKITNESTGAVEYAIVEYADNPTVAGTPIASNIFKNINNYIRHENACEVGRIAMTKNPSEIGEDWLYCNGDRYNGYEYPELSSVISETILTNYSSNTYGPMWDINDTVTPADMQGHTYLNCGFVNNNFCIITQDPETNNLYIFYADKATSASWQKHVVATNVNIFSEPNQVMLSSGNNYYIISAVNSNNNVVIYYSSTLGGEWNATTISGVVVNELSRYGLKIKYANGNFAFVGIVGELASSVSASTAFAYLFVSSNLKDWTNNKISEIGAMVYDSKNTWISGILSNIDYDGNNWVVCSLTSRNTSSTSTSYHRSRCYYASDLAGTWTEMADIYTKGQVIAAIEYSPFNQKWFMWGVYGFLVFADVNSSSADIINLTSSEDACFIILVKSSFVKCGGSYWSYYYTKRSINSSSTSDLVRIFSPADANNEYVRGLGLMADNNYVVVVYSDENGAGINILAGSVTITPTLTSDDYYYYIKARRTGEPNE